MCAGCPLFGRCGGCEFDFAAPDYRDKKLALISKIDITGNPIWFGVGQRRRGDFCFAGGHFGFFAKNSKDIVNVDKCPLMMHEINAMLPRVAKLPWVGAGACMITVCDNGIDVAITSNVEYASREFRDMAGTIGAIRVSWNGRVLYQSDAPMVRFGKHTVEYPIGAFLQPTIQSADLMRQMVIDAARGYKHIADLFAGIGNFTFATGADGFDIVGAGRLRDLFVHPLTNGMLKQYDCVIMDPPRAGALAQSKILAATDVQRVIYISCNPHTWARDAGILTRGGYKLHTIIPIDQFIGSAHWELFTVFDK